MGLRIPAGAGCNRRLNLDEGHGFPGQLKKSQTDRKSDLRGHVAFQNTLDHGNAGTTRAYSQTPFAAPFIPLPSRMPNQSDLWARTPEPKRIIWPLTSNLKRRYILE
jgi:hypothetical protein